MTYKAMIVGYGAVGKTSLIQNMKESFNLHEKSTIGVDFFTRPYKVFNDDVTMGYWDCAGQERFRFLMDEYARGAQSAMLLFSVVDRTSFDDLENWEGILAGVGVKPEQIVYVGNKYDLVEADPSQAQVSTEEFFEHVREKNGLMGFYTSAKTGYNVGPAFEVVSYRAVYKYRVEQEEKARAKDPQFGGDPLMKPKFKGKIKSVLDQMQGETYFNPNL